MISPFLFLEFVPIILFIIITLIGVRQLKNEKGGVKNAGLTAVRIHTMLSPVLYFAVVLPIAIGIDEFEFQSGTLFVLRSASAILVFAFTFLLALRANHVLQTEGRGHADPKVGMQTKKLATGGLYGRARHPMALAILFLLAGEFIFFLTFGVLIATLSTACAYIFFVHSFEEEELRIRFGRGAYESYRSRVPFMIPRRPLVFLKSVLDYGRT